jgi:hypothetical protein
MFINHHECVKMRIALDRALHNKLPGEIQVDLNPDLSDDLIADIHESNYYLVVEFTHCSSRVRSKLTRLVSLKCPKYLTEGTPILWKPPIRDNGIVTCWVRADIMRNLRMQYN